MAKGWRFQNLGQSEANRCKFLSIYHVFLLLDRNNQCAKLQGRPTRHSQISWQNMSKFRFSPTPFPTKMPSANCPANTVAPASNRCRFPAKWSLPLPPRCCEAKIWGLNPLSFANSHECGTHPINSRNSTVSRGRLSLWLQHDHVGRCSVVLNVTSDLLWLLPWKSFFSADSNWTELACAIYIHIYIYTQS